jgi:hypothetical protein
MKLHGPPRPLGHQQLERSVVEASTAAMEGVLATLMVNRCG